MSNEVFRIKCGNCGKVITKHGKSAEILYTVRELLWEYNDLENMGARNKGYVSVLSLLHKTMGCCKDPYPQYYTNDKGVKD